MRLFSSPPIIDHGPELAELRSRCAEAEAENRRLKNKIQDVEHERDRISEVAERRRIEIERMAGERDKAVSALNDCRKAIIDLEARLAAAKEGALGREESLSLVMEVASKELSKYRPYQGS